MGEYSKKLDIYEYDKFIKDLKCFMIRHDLSVNDIAYGTGYAVNTVYAALNNYDRCSRFFAAMVDEYMRRHEKDV